MCKIEGYLIVYTDGEKVFTPSPSRAEAYLKSKRAFSTIERIIPLFDNGENYHLFPKKIVDI